MAFFDTFDSLWYTGIILIVLIIIIFWIYMESKFKFKVRIKEVVNGRLIIKNCRARYYEDKDKSAWWRLSNERRSAFKLIPLPPEESIEIDNKGKKYIEVYRFETGEVVFIKDDWKIDSIPDFDIPPKEIQADIDKAVDYQLKKDLFDRWKTKAIKEWKEANKILSPYQPITTNQRMGYFHNIKKAEERKGFDWKANILPITAISGFVIIILGLMIFWGEIAQPALQAGEITKQNLALQKETAEILKDIKLNQQSIKSEVNNINNKVDNIKQDVINE